MRMLKNMYNINIATQKTSTTYIDCINLLKVRIISCYHCFFCRGFSIFSEGLPQQPAQHVLSGQKLHKLHDAKILYVFYFMSTKIRLRYVTVFFLPGPPEVLPYTSPMLCMSLDWLKEIFTGNDFRRGWEKPKSSCEAASAAEVPGGKWTQKSMAACVTGQRILKWLLWSIMIYYVSLRYKDKSVSSLRLCQCHKVLVIHLI